MAESAPTPEADERACRVCAGYYSLDDGCDDDGFCHGCAHELASELTRMRERCAELEEALRPFAHGCLNDPGAPSWDLLRPAKADCCINCAARAALERKPDGE